MGFKTNKKILLAFTLLMTLVACGDKGGGSGNNTNGNVGVIGVNPQCANCVGLNGTTLFTANSVDSYGVISFNWNFTSSVQNTNYPQPVYGGGYNSGYPQPIYGGGFNGQNQGNYVGPVGATGAMTLNQTLNLGYCQIPAGVYTLGTVQMGNWQYSMVSNLRMQAAGPAVINLNLTQGQVSSFGYLQPGQVSSSSATSGRLFANVMIESVNGYNCQMAILVQ